MSSTSAPAVGVIFNPHARKNRISDRNIQKIRDAIGDLGIVVETRSIDEVASALKTFDKRGIRTIIADGGDGAMHWAIHEAVQVYGLDRALSEFRFAPSAGGTIDFIATALGLSGKPHEISARIAQAVAGEGSETIRELRSLKLTMTYANGQSETRYVYGAALAGYGANFYGPFYRSYRFRGPIRIVGLLSYAFGAAALGGLFRGPLAHRKPEFVREAEYDYLRPLVGAVEVDGKPVKGGGKSGREFNILQCGAVHINLGNVIKVFEAAEGDDFHAHAGFIPASKMLPEVIRAGIGKRIGAASVHDGATRSLRVSADAGHAMIPCLDGELFDDVTHITVERGPAFSFVIV